MKPIYNGILDFTGLNNISSLCGIEIYKKERNLVFITELPENRGTSVTNGIEIIVCKLFIDFNIKPTNTIYIEHYPPEYYRLYKTSSEIDDAKDTFDLITLTTINPIEKLKNKEYHKNYSHFVKVLNWTRLNLTKNQILDLYLH